MTANLDRLYRVTLAGILLDDDYPGGAQSTADLPGWFDGPPVRSGVTTHAGQDVGSASAGLAGPRVVTVVGSCHDASPAAVVAFQSQLAAIPLTQAVDLVVESVRSGSAMSARVWLTRAVEVEWQTERRFVYTIEVTAPDPLKYGAALVDLLGVPTGASVGTGRAWPRVWVRSWGVDGSFIADSSSSFEDGGTGAWGTAYFGASDTVTLSNTSTRAWSGTKSMRVTWPTSAGSVGTQLYVSTVAGRTYTATARVYVLPGSPAVRWGDMFGATPVATSSTTGAWESLSVTWTATTDGVYLVLGAAAATTAGQFVDVDGVDMYEGSSVGTPVQSTTVPNAGTATYWPTVRIDGPVTNPLLFTTSGDSIRVVRDIAAGQWVDVDCGKRRVTLNGQVSLRNATKASGAWLAVQPGGSAIGWTADGAGESATVTILAYEGAWW